jgi:hypothetical protein
VKRAKTQARKANKTMRRQTPDSGPPLSAAAGMQLTTAATNGDAQGQEKVK